MSKRNQKIILASISLLVVVIVFLPILLMIPSMFKDKFEIWAYPWHLIPLNPTIDNFSRLFYLQHTTLGVRFLKSMLTTTLIASIAVVFSLTLNMLAAFAFARLNFKFKKPIWLVIISTMFIPSITILLTSIWVVNKLQMLDTISVLVIPGLVSAYNIFFFRQFYLGFPQEIDDAAKIDGAKTYQVFTLIYLPMSKTPMVIIGASIFMGYYNSYLWPTLTISSNRKDLYQIMSVIRMLFSDSTVIGYGSVLAASFVTLIVPLIIFIFVQNYIREGIQLSGIK